MCYIKRRWRTAHGDQTKTKHKDDKDRTALCMLRYGMCRRAITAGTRSAKGRRRMSLRRKEKETYNVHDFPRL